MSTHICHSDKDATWFCTITCYQWLSLFEESDSHECVYNWFDALIKNNCYILAYVIMPNHIHCQLHPTAKPLNSLVSNGKRLMAYFIVKKLKDQNKHKLLRYLEKGVQQNERIKGKKHQVFR